jgi:transposase
MSGFIKGENRQQATLFPEQLDDYISEDNSVRVIDVFVDSLKLRKLGFAAKPNNNGRPGYDPALMQNCMSTAILTAFSSLGD